MHHGLLEGVRKKKWRWAGGEVGKPPACKAKSSERGFHFQVSSGDAV
jgi:hypothetical protein